MNKSLNIYSDGGARGNPGPAAIGFVVLSRDKTIHSFHQFIGTATNNFAEYKAVIAALNWLSHFSKTNSLSNVNFFLDSMLVVNQISGKFKTKNHNLKELNSQALSQIKKLKVPIKLFNIPREQNKLADSLVNKALDQQPSF